MSKLNKVLLTDKEMYLLWTIACWFNKPVTSTLKYKLAGLSFMPERNELDKKYEHIIEDRIIEIGEFLKRKREAAEIYEALPEASTEETT